MVKYQTAALDRTFAALADPTRRALLARLGEHASVSVSDLARPFPVSLPAIMKHLDVLSDAGLITRAKTGRTVACRLSAAPMERAMEWLNRYQRFWSTQLDRLAAFVEEDACLPDPNLSKPNLPQPKPLEKPSLTLKRRLNAPPSKVFAAWTDPEKLAQWFGPADTVAGSASAELDVRVGGRFRVRFSTTNGEQHEVGGVYREVTPDQRLVFTWAWRSTPERELLVSVALRPDGAATLLTLTHEQFFDQAARDGHERGWTGTLDKLERYFG